MICYEMAFYGPVFCVMVRYFVLGQGRVKKCRLLPSPVYSTQCAVAAGCFYNMLHLLFDKLRLL